MSLVSTFLPTSSLLVSAYILISFYYYAVVDTLSPPISMKTFRPRSFVCVMTRFQVSHTQ